MKTSIFKGIIIGVFSISALAGLFVFSTYTSNNSGENTIGPVVIWGTISEDGIKAALAVFVQVSDNLKNVSYVQKNPSTIASELSTAIATDSSPDLVLASQEELGGLAKFIAPIPFSALSASTFQNTFVDGAGILAMPGGYYGIPFLIDPMVLFSNRSILSSNGIARPPVTWEAITGLVPSIAILTPNRQITRGLIALGTYNNVHNARGILSSLFLQTGVPISSYSSMGVLSANLGSSESGNTSGQAVLGFYTQFADPTKVSYTWNASLADSRQMFLFGDLAFYLGYVSEARYLREANPNLDFNVTVLPQPATASAKKAYGLIYSFMIPRGANNPAGAYQIASLLTNPDEQFTFASYSGLAPVNLNVLATPPDSSTAAVAYAEALYTKGWMSTSPSDTDAVFSGMINNVISGRLTIESALASGERALSALLQQ